MKKKLMKAVFAALALALMASGCATDPAADVASENLSTAADNFEIPRRVVFYNGITDTYMLEVTGFCSIGNNDTPGLRSVTCRTPEGKYVKHYLGLSDNVTIIVEQLDAVEVSEDHYRVIYRPQTLLPAIELGL